MRQEKLELIIAQKKERLSPGIELLGPKDDLDIETQADWMISLLCQMYVQHGITKNRDGLLCAIRDGSCKPWFAVRDGLPIASAALVRQSDGSVEVGRAVSLENGVGGLLMLMAAVDHMENSDKPLVAEVRVADNFAGVPSGEATQIICFRHLDLFPQALVPAFEHGKPKRQEMFVFSASKKVRAMEPAFFPGDRTSADMLVDTAMGFVDSVFMNPVEVRVGQEQQRASRWDLVCEAPFPVLVPGREGSDLETTVRAAELKNSFSLIPLGMSPQNTGAVVECLNLGFVPCGFDRNLDPDGYPVLLMGKLRKGTLVAPIKIVSGLLDPGLRATINQIDQQFRSGI